MTIYETLVGVRACKESQNWACDLPRSTTPLQAWRACANPAWLLWWLTEGYLTDEEYDRDQDARCFGLDWPRVRRLVRILNRSGEPADYYVGVSDVLVNESELTTLDEDKAVCDLIRAFYPYPPLPR